MNALTRTYKECLEVFKHRLVAVAGYSFIASLCLLAVPAFLFQIYDRVLLSRSTETLIAMSIIALVVLFSYAVFDSVRQFLLAKAAVEFERKLAGPVLAAELARQSDPSTQSVKDIGAIRQVASSAIFAQLFDLPMVPLFTLIIFLIHPVLGGVLLLGACALVALTLYADKKTAPENKELMEASIATYKALETQVRMQELVRAHGSYREAVAQWGKHNAVQLSRFLSGQAQTSRYSSISKALRQLLQISMIGVGAALVLADQASVGVIFGASIIGSRALAPVEAIVGGWRNLRQAWSTKSRLETRLEDLVLPVDRTQLPEPKGVLGLGQVAYVPRPGAPALLRNIHATFEPGDSIAVIGPSGAGKSTLARLLVGFIEPSAGKVMLDGQDLRAWDPTARGLYMGYMPQNVDFFEATIRENIARMRIDDDPARAIEAAQKAGVHDLIVKFPMGYDTPMSRTGFWPSGGQAQLIALARAFYGNPKILVLDEPNAALDATGEQIFHRALMNAKKVGLTMVVITQRPSMLQFVDKVMLLQDGQIKDFGPKEKVLKSNLVRSAPAAGTLQGGAPKAQAHQQGDGAKAAPANQPADKSGDITIDLSKSGTK